MSKIMFVSYLRAGYPVLWVQTSELDRAERELAKEARALGDEFQIWRWDIQRGVSNVPRGVSNVPPIPNTASPLAAITASITKAPERSVVFLHNFHKFIGSIEIVQVIQNCLPTLEATNRFLVVLSPLGGEAVPVELQKLVTVIEFGLPNRDDLQETLIEIAASASDDLHENSVPPLLDAATGLTAFEARNAFSLSRVVNGRFDATVIAEMKGQMVKKNAALSLSSFRERFNRIGGLDNLKEFTLRTARDERARGILLLGVPGVGKSLFAKALGNELRLPTLSLDMGAVFGSLVGESERKVGDALKIVDAMQPAVLFIDEIEKGLAGSQSSGQTDSGVSARVFGKFLTWLSDHESRVFVVATANAIEKLPPEFIRAERWDAVFFVDLPNEEERQVILDLYLSEYQIGRNQPIPSLMDWSGAEIKSLCRIAAMMKSSLVEAAQYVIPLAHSAVEKITALREWAATRCVPASRDKSPAQVGRKIF